MAAAPANAATEAAIIGRMPKNEYTAPPRKLGISALTCCT